MPVEIPIVWMLAVAHCCTTNLDNPTNFIEEVGKGHDVESDLPSVKLVQRVNGIEGTGVSHFASSIAHL